MEILHLKELADRANVVTICSLRVHLVVDNFCMYFSDALPLYQILNQSDNFKISNIWGIQQVSSRLQCSESA